MRGALSPLLATVILAAIVASAGLIIFGLTSGMFGSLAPKHSFEVVDVDLVRASTGGMLSVAVKNTGSATALLVKVSVATDSGTAEFASGSTKHFYLVYVDGISGQWVDPSAFYQGAVNVLSSASNAAVTRVSTLSDLDVLVRSPPEGAVVINCHGERIPMPTTWPNWWSYYDALSGATAEKGWIFVTANGYPLYYTQRETVGASGLDRFLSRIGASADAWGSTSHSPTAEGAEALSWFGITPADPLSGARTVAWSGVTPSFTFYSQNGGRHLAAAVPMGGGYYLNIEASRLSAYDGGRYAAAFAYWLADRAQLKPGQVRGFTLTGLQVTPGQKYALTVTVYWQDGGSASKTLTVACRP